jgi:hypothetical protein
MKTFVIRWASSQGRIVDTKLYAPSAREAVERFRRDFAILLVTRRIPRELDYNITGIFDATWFDGIDGRPEGIHLHLVAE